MSLLCAAAAGLVAWFGSSGFEAGGHAPALRAFSQATDPVPVWVPVGSARPAFASDLEDDAASERIYSARRHRDGGREDSLAIGSAEAAAFARIDVARGDVGGEPANLYVDAVRRAAATGASVMRMGQRFSVATKFGSVEAAPVVLSAGSERACLAFRFEHSELALRLNGFLCSALERPTTSQELACFVDGLAYLGGTDDPALKVLFAQVDNRRSPGCGPAPRTVAARKS